ncbi:MAG: hypothetical protein L0191_12325 [Acidobacteria bacterium]|nr:hypothetical protein [Acidobacteriota bacterium]MCI0569035.1 hypothetical protein [Acidobacteriota bacterium]
MRPNFREPPPAARAAAFDPDLLHSRSILIYVRSSLVLTLLLYATIMTMLYSDLYVHLIRQARDAFQHLRVIPGSLFIVLMALALALAIRMKPLLEKAALGIVAMNLAVLFLRGKMAGHSDAYLALCLLSLVLDLALLATVVAFYRKYPNVLQLLRQKARE